MLVVAMAGVLAAQAAEVELWGRLEAGAHAVGYRSYFQLDKARRYGGGKGPRPILVVMWYPAAADGEAMAYREYFDVPALPQYPDFPRRLHQFLLETLNADVFGVQVAGEGTVPPYAPAADARSALNAEERAFLDALLQHSTRAHRNAAPATGHFPVLLHHPGAAGSYEDNSVLCEYLASHGYVVITSAFPSEDGRHVSNNFKGSQVSLQDMAFLLAHARGLPFADADRAGAIGHSIGAWRVLEWMGQKHTPLRAAVSLDTTLEYTAEDDPRHHAVRKIFARLPPVKAPVLVVASADRQPRMSTWNRYLPERRELLVPLFWHSDYLTHGILAREFKGDRGPQFRREYEKMVEAVRAFFDGNVRATTPAVSSGTRSQTR